MRPRFSIAGLAAFVALSGIAFASIRSPSQLWASAIFVLALGSLPYGLLNAVYSRGRARAYWVGFTTVGSLYFMASLGPWFRDEWGPRMVTTAALDLLYTQVAPPTQTSWTTTINAPATWTAINAVQAPTPTQPPPPAGPVTTIQGVVDQTTLNIQATSSPPNISYTTNWAWPANGVVFLGSPPTPDTFRSRWDAWSTPDRTDGVGWQIGNFGLVGTAPYRRIGHSLLTIAFAAIGGAYAGRLQGRLAARAARPAVSAEPG